MLLKWRLIFTSLPYAVMVLIIKMILLFFFDFEGLLDIKEIQLILTAGVFLIGFMLAGTLSDYKESEKIPGELAATLEAIEDISLALASQTKSDENTIKKEILNISHQIQDWFYNKIDDKTLFDTLYQYNKRVKALDQAGAHPPIIGRLLYLQNDLRQLITRASVISKTGFLQTGYALLELLIVIITILLLFAHFTSSISNIFIILFVELIYIYMYKLIRDIDDPFEYDEEGQGGSAEVDLFPLHDYINRLENRINE